MRTDDPLRYAAIEIVEVRTLRGYDRNARTHSDEQVAQLAAAIQRFGFTNPILADEAGIVIAGHGRMAAARKLGLDRVPCIRVTGLGRHAGLDHDLEGRVGEPAREEMGLPLVPASERDALPRRQDAAPVLDQGVPRRRGGPELRGRPAAGVARPARRRARRAAGTGRLPPGAGLAAAPAGPDRGPRRAPALPPLRPPDRRLLEPGAPRRGTAVAHVRSGRLDRMGERRRHRHRRDRAAAAGRASHVRRLLDAAPPGHARPDGGDPGPVPLAQRRAQLGPEEPVPRLRPERRHRLGPRRDPHARRIPARIPAGRGHHRGRIRLHRRPFRGHPRRPAPVRRGRASPHRSGRSTDPRAGSSTSGRRAIPSRTRSTPSPSTSTSPTSTSSSCWPTSPA